jgi:hypothetical protein
MPEILATQEAKIRNFEVWSQPEQIVHKTLSQKTLHKKGLVEWLKVKALSSNPSTAKQQQQQQQQQNNSIRLGIVAQSCNPQDCGLVPA